MTRQMIMKEINLINKFNLKLDAVNNSFYSEFELGLPNELRSSELVKNYHRPQRELVTLLHIKNIYDNVNHYNQSYFAVVEGPHRAGKSTWAIQLACLLDSSFYKDMENRVVYTPIQFMSRLNRLVEENKHGRVIVWDEAGVGLNNRDWYTNASKAIVKAIQIMGWINPIILFVIQRRKFLDAIARMFIKELWIIKRTNNKYNIITPYEYEYNELFQDIYFRKPHIYINNREYVLGSFRYHGLPHEIEERYIETSTNWKSQIIDDLNGVVENNLLENIKLDMDSILQIIHSNLPKYLLKSKKGMSLNTYLLKSTFPYLKSDDINFIRNSLSEDIYKLNMSHKEEKINKLKKKVLTDPDKYKVKDTYNTTLLSSYLNITVSEAKLLKILLEREDES